MTSRFARPVALLFLLGVPLAAGVPTAPPAYLCSKIGFIGVRASDQAHMIGTALSDTVLSGPSCAALCLRWPARFTEFMKRSQAGLPPETPARFIRAANGSVRVEQLLVLEDGRALTIRGERVSRVPVACAR